MSSCSSPSWERSQTGERNKTKMTVTLWHNPRCSKARQALELPRRS